MKRPQAFKFVLRPNGEQKRAMYRFAGCCRFVYNKALALQKEHYDAGNKFISYVSMAAKLPIWKRDLQFSWLKSAPSQALQHALKDLDRAYHNFFAKGWGEFRRQLAYKMVWNGGIMLAVAPQNTSQTCPSCTHIAKDNRRTQARFLCIHCGYENNADVVGAVNILERGHRLLACGELVQSDHFVKQEPIEVTQAFA